jgi:hypothetical protein
MGGRYHWYASKGFEYDLLALGIAITLVIDVEKLLEGESV